MGILRICVIEASALAGFLISACAIEAQEPTIQRGRAFAQANCARCHAIGPSGESPLPKAPPFRTLHERYPVEDLMESFAEGIRTGHPRIHLACRLLAGGRPIVEAAMDAGFADQSHLTRAFIRQFGVTPGRYVAARA
jgi:cytochrome c